MFMSSSRRESPQKTELTIKTRQNNAHQNTEAILVGAILVHTFYDLIATPKMRENSEFPTLKDAYLQGK